MKDENPTIPRVKREQREAINFEMKKKNLEKVFEETKDLETCSIEIPDFLKSHKI